MKSRNVTIWVVVAVAMTLAVVKTVRAEDTYWVGTTGDWFDPANWQYKVPEAGDAAYIDNGGTAEIGAGSAQAQIVYAGFANTGSINHTGGTVGLGEIFLGHFGNSIGIYNLSGTGGLTTTSRQVIGWESGSKGIFNQTGGTNSTSSYIVLGYFSGSEGTYNLSGTGQVISAGNQRVGYRNGSTGIFNQSGGDNSVGQNLILGSDAGSNGRYTISGGTLTAKELQVGSFGAGRFDIESSSASITLSDLLFGADSVFTAVSGSTIHMTGSSLDNWNTDETDLSGLNNLSLIFEGGAGVGTFEVAGQDIRPVMSGLDENFALDALILGGDDIGQVQLVDWRDNMPGTEALYVKHFILGNGSYLDLNGLNLYYLTFTDYGRTIDLKGGQLAQIPAPGTLVLGSIGVGFVGWLRRRRML